VIRFDRKPGLVIYLTAGDPSLAITRDMAIAAIDAGADVIELGVPFSDPLADGPVIQRASERAVARGTRLADVLECCLDIRKLRPHAGIILFSYLNPVLQFGSLHARILEIQTSVEGEGRYIRVISPSGMYAHVKLRVEPNATGAGFEFIVDTDSVMSAIETSSHPQRRPIQTEYLEAIEAGIHDAMRGAGHEIVDVKVTLTGGSSHEVESSPAAFRAAASMAFSDAVQEANSLAGKQQNSMMRFCSAAKAAGADGVLLTDMIVEEAAEYLEAMRENDLAPVFLAAPTSPDDRLRAIAEHSRGFVYAISRVGITGTQTELAADAEQLVRRLKQFTQLPIALGFGISTPQHVEAVSHFADAAVVGSAVVALIERTPPEQAAAAVGDFVRSLRGATGRPHNEIVSEVHA